MELIQRVELHELDAGLAEDLLARDDGKEEEGKSRDRKNVSVKLSYDEGQTWPVSKTVEPGWSAYTDLAVTKSGTILRTSSGDNLLALCGVRRVK